MTTCVENIPAKNYQNLVIGFQVTIQNVEDAFLRHSAQYFYTMQENSLILRLLDVRWPNVARANIVKDNSVVKFQISDQQKRKNE